ncbi:MAG: hypothetical protein R2865_14405 [Deinococcales bacterium]
MTAPSPKISLLPLETPLLDIYSLLNSDPQTLSLKGQDWQAYADASFSGLYIESSGQYWRAVAGYPLWAYQDYLLVYDNQAIKLYRFYPSN